MYKKVLGLEIHAQIATKTKLVSTSLCDDTAAPNTNVTWVDAGMPGSLPIINEDAIHMAAKTALALGMEINHISEFDRKQYFYQDLPLGYQITQFYKPIGVNGVLECSFGPIRINRLHIETDAGKSVYENDSTLVDLNRAGIPLMEIVTEPDFKNAEEVIEFLKELRTLLLCLQTCKCDMSAGNLRADVNLSLHKEGEPYGTRVEIKNLNSYRFIGKAIEYEAKVQEETIEAGGQIRQETKLFDSHLGVTKSMRDKEEAADYRYFADPDLLPVLLDAKFIADMKAELPELPQQVRARYMNLGVAKEQAYVLTEHPLRIDFFNKMIAEFDNKHLDKYAPLASNWIASELLGRLSKQKVEFEEFIENMHADFINQFAKIVVYADGKISRNNAKILLDELLESDINIDVVVKERGYADTISDAQVMQVIEKIIADFPDEVKKYKSGKTNLLMFFVGGIMRETKGKCDPEFVREQCIRKLEND